MIQVYWTLLPALVAFLVVMEMLKSSDQQPNVNDILRRTVISILLLLSFGTVVNTVAMLSDGITARIDQTQSLWEAIKNLGPNSQGESGSLFDMRTHVIYFFAIGAYLIAYIGFFASVALMNFVWAILYVCAPLMILCFVPRATSGIVGNLYRGLTSVAIWKILWTLLGSLLLKLAVNPKVVGVDDYILSMVMNLLIGLSMLLIPLFTKSLLGDGLQSAAATLAAAPGLMATKAAMITSKAFGKRLIGGATNLAGFTSKPLTNPLTGRAKVMAHRMKPHVRQFKNWYSQSGLPTEAKELVKKERRRQFAINRNRR
ncbi:MAG: hypothetical protein K2X47_01375 [Bdellovibrionales bacterium]|nr:hypothetical protein [Bdellovibrionales bacterium]